MATKKKDNRTKQKKVVEKIVKEAQKEAEKYMVDEVEIEEELERLENDNSGVEGEGEVQTEYENDYTTTPTLNSNNIEVPEVKTFIQASYYSLTMKMVDKNLKNKLKDILINPPSELDVTEYLNKLITNDKYMNVNKFIDYCYVGKYVYNIDNINIIT